MLFKNKKKILQARRQKQIRKIKKQLKLQEANTHQGKKVQHNKEPQSIVSSITLPLSNALHFLMAIPMMMFSVSLSVIYLLSHTIERLLVSTITTTHHLSTSLITPPILFCCYFTSILTYSTKQWITTNTDHKESQVYEDLFERMKKMERSFTNLQNKHTNLQNQLKAQQIELTKRSKTTTKIVYRESHKSKPLTSKKMKSQAQIAVCPAPPPPPTCPLPPPPIFETKKIIFKRSTGVTKKKEPTSGNVSGGFSLNDVVGARKGLKKERRRSPLPDSALPKPSGFGVSLSDITSIQLKKRANQANKENRKPTNVKGLPSLFKLRNTGVQRSPGGTPMKESIAINADSPANIMIHALRKKFKGVHTSPRAIPVALSPHSKFSPMRT